MTLGEIVREYRLDHGMSMDEFSKRSGISKGYISMLENNCNPKTKMPIAPSVRCIKKAANGMQMDFNILFEKIDSDVDLTPEELSDYFQIPLLSRCLPGEDWPREEFIIGSVGVSREDLKTGSRFALYSEDGALTPLINEGDIVIIRPQEDYADNDIVAVCIDGKTAVCRFMTTLKDGIILTSLRSDFAPEIYHGKDRERVKIVGRVRESRKKY